jgi:FG-GAP repeat
MRNHVATRIALAIALVTACSVTALHAATTQAHAVDPAAPWDFNGDGYPDLVVRAPYDNVDEIDEGMIHFLPGGPDGVDETAAISAQIEDIGLADQHEARMGWSLASADFDVDGFADLAVGVPLYDRNATQDAGAVIIVPGSSDGPDLASATTFAQGVNGVAGTREAEDLFGWSLAAGDFDGDDRPDLAVAARGEDTAAGANVGYVHVLSATDDGITAASIEKTFTAASVGAPTPTGDLLGFAMTAGDFDGDSIDDLAVSAATADGFVGAPAQSGYVVTVPGSPSGIQPSEATIVHGNSAGIDGSADTGDWFGSPLAAADFDDDGDSELVIGVPMRDIGATIDAGVVHVLQGTPSGITSAGSLTFHQNVAGIGDQVEAIEYFGTSFDAGDINGDGNLDLAVGVPGENAQGYDNTGAFHVIFGTSSGLSGIGSKVYTRASTDVAGDPGTDHLMGASLVVRDFNDNNRADLAIGVRGDDVLGNNDAGSVHLFRGNQFGVSVTNDRIITEIAFGDGPQPNDWLGV